MLGFLNLSLKTSVQTVGLQNTKEATNGSFLLFGQFKGRISGEAKKELVFCAIKL